MSFEIFLMIAVFTLLDSFLWWKIHRYSDVNYFLDAFLKKKVTIVKKASMQFFIFLVENFPTFLILSLCMKEGGSVGEKLTKYSSELKCPFQLLPGYAYVL